VAVTLIDELNSCYISYINRWE